MISAIKTVFKYLNQKNGNSLMEFAVTTALMAILAATAAPKLSIISEGARFRKSNAELDKLARQALNFYQDTAAKEGRGRFPGQDKYDDRVGGHSSEQDIIDDILGTSAVYDENGNMTSAAIDPTFRYYSADDGSHWLSVFGSTNADSPKPENATLGTDDAMGITEWKKLFGDETLGSPYQDGHYVYQVIPGLGSGSKAIAPIMYLADIENPSQIHFIVQP